MLECYNMLMESKESIKQELLELLKDEDIRQELVFAIATGHACITLQNLIKNFPLLQPLTSPQQSSPE